MKKLTFSDLVEFFGERWAYSYGLSIRTDSDGLELLRKNCVASQVETSPLRNLFGIPVILDESIPKNVTAKIVSNSRFYSFEDHECWAVKAGLAHWEYTVSPCYLLIDEHPPELSYDHPIRLPTEQEIMQSKIRLMRFR